MKCPQDVDVELVMSERQGVEIDYCPACRGVWLDRGELDKILDRAADQLAGSATAAPSAPGHVSGEGGAGPAPTPGYATGYAGGDPGPAAGYGSGGHRSGGYAAPYGSGDRPRYGLEDRPRYDDDRGRYGEDRPRYDDDRSRYGQPGYDPRRKKRKESWLGDLLDFG